MELVCPLLLLLKSQVLLLKIILKIVDVLLQVLVLSLFHVERLEQFLDLGLVVSKLCVTGLDVSLELPVIPFFVVYALI